MICEYQKAPGRSPDRSTSKRTISARVATHIKIWRACHARLVISAFLAHRDSSLRRSPVAISSNVHENQALFRPDFHAAMCCKSLHRLLSTVRTFQRRQRCSGLFSVQARPCSIGSSASARIFWMHQHTLDAQRRPGHREPLHDRQTSSPPCSPCSAASSCNHVAITCSIVSKTQMHRRHRADDSHTTTERFPARHHPD